MSKIDDLDELIQEAFAYGCNYQSQLTLENPTNAEKFLKEKESLRELGKDFVPVPREPTEEMMSEIGRMSGIPNRGWDKNRIKAIYKAMIQASE